MARAFIPGIDLALQFYTEVVAPLLDTTLNGAPYSAALLGYGSEVQGFDTERSTDHAWGPRLQVFLAGEDFHAHAASLDAFLDRELPDEFRGYPVRFSFPHDAPPRHWVHVENVFEFFTHYLVADPTGDLSVSEWLMVPTQTLRELTGGQVFHDALLATISDSALRDLPPLGAIDQYVDSTDLIDCNYVDRRSRYIAGPSLV